MFFPEIFRDHRGKYIETFNEKAYHKYQLPHFVQDDVSVSRKNVLRGLHGDHKTYKLIQCLHGKIMLAVADIRIDSPTYKQWETFILDDETHQQVLVPKGFVNGHLCLSDTCIFSYKQSTYYEGQGAQISIKWNDPSFEIEWPEGIQPILSERDNA